MKYNKRDRQAYSDAIDKMQEGLDAMIDLYNEAEEDVDLIQFDEDLIELIKKAKKKHGEQLINKKVAAIVREVIELLTMENEK
ncbi:atypical membrane-integrating protein (Mistic protein) [Fictibacillus aquaticus]|uniref:Atypical membrane-integrating protein (Mistic protein) n=1 Tax=Fictibacillus aquaticus TaxID=2021314 RepID=A0A235F4E4_9BACL|nr:hypothetical protein [Fictibacillus aquaticus]OYD56140.1 hypothetical protein CGZ90_19105 [Fictibacillus aquaticus]